MKKKISKEVNLIFMICSHISDELNLLIRFVFFNIMQVLIEACNSLL